MTLPANLPALLRDAGLTVAEVDGWKTRGRPGVAPKTGVLNHHTGASAKGWTRAKELTYAKWMFLTGRSDLPAPLCQIALGRSGVVYIGAAGRANHAGTAKASGSVAAGDGNALYIGIEWMLSGTEAIPAKMMQAGITLNAVLSEKVTGNSVKTISAHYQTSVTGKWDIGDPNGVAFKGAKVLDVDKFRTAVQERRKDLYAAKPEPAPAPGKEYTDLRVAHMSMWSRKTVKEWEHDSSVIFSRGYDWITGTEAGETQRWRVLRATARKNGYRIHRYKSNWVAVKKSIIKKGTFWWNTETVIEKEKVAGPGHDTNVVWATFRHKKKRIGTISVMASHYPTKGKPVAETKNAAKRVNLKWTTLLGKWIGAKGKELGKGKALAFYGGDQNIRDNISDTFFGGPMLSCWDELKKWPNTGHGNIDVIARFKGDGRVTCIKARAYNDKQLFLYSDHFLIEATYRVNLLPKKN